SPENPVGTLERAYELIRVREFTASPITQVILASGDYTLPHGIALFGANFTLIGGWSWNPDTNVWTPPTSGRSDIEITNVCPCDPAIDSTGECVQSRCEPQKGYVAAIDIASPSGVRLSNLNLRVAAQPVARGPVVGVACWLIGTGDGPVASCASLALNQVRIQMENALAGEPHSAPAVAGESGRQSSGRTPPPCESEYSCVLPGFDGGVSSCGASGGTGAGSKAQDCYIATPGSMGLPAGWGGAAGEIPDYTIYSCNSSPVGPGGRGRSRVEPEGGGGRGIGATAYAPLSSTPTFATAGGAGLPGGGGGGGGSTGGFPIEGGARFGGGGSSGGCGGDGGFAGRRGGSLIGLLIDDQFAGPVLRGVEVNVGSGGAGGAGQAGGAGGTGIGPVDQGARTLGGASGHGAGGGGGGGGAGGSVIGIARWPSVRVVLTPIVGTAGAGGPGGAGGAGGTGGIMLTLDAAPPVFETAAGGVAGTRGADGVSARFCSLAPGAPPAGEVSCR
ncbi:MAG: hypothetical protein KGO50_01475, partial [Myxococcales bacterium]|nr:hypothetical protein [Myxococcales bacterium]